ncbi:MAG: SRPBCC domain-containing protein, partial [Chloroflexota bacterium]
MTERTARSEPDDVTRETNDGGLRHVFELEIAAGSEEVWRALTDPDLTQRYFYDCRLETTLEAGTPYAYRSSRDPQPGMEGTVLVAEPPHRLQLTAAYRFAEDLEPSTREDAPHRVTWEIEPIAPAGGRRGKRCRVRVTSDRFAGETATFKWSANVTLAALRGLKN